MTTDEYSNALHRDLIKSEDSFSKVFFDKLAENQKHGKTKTKILEKDAKELKNKVKKQLKDGLKKADSKVKEGADADIVIGLLDKMNGDVVSLFDKYVGSRHVLSIDAVEHLGRVIEQYKAGAKNLVLEQAPVADELKESENHEEDVELFQCKLIEAASDAFDLAIPELQAQLIQRHRDRLAEGVAERYSKMLEDFVVAVYKEVTTSDISRATFSAKNLVENILQRESFQHYGLREDSLFDSFFQEFQELFSNLPAYTERRDLEVQRFVFDKDAFVSAFFEERREYMHMLAELKDESLRRLSSEELDYITGLGDVSKEEAMHLLNKEFHAGLSFRSLQDIPETSVVQERIDFLETHSKKLYEVALSQYMYLDAVYYLLAAKKGCSVVELKSNRFGQFRKDIDALFAFIQSVQTQRLALVRQEPSELLSLYFGSDLEKQLQLDEDEARSFISSIHKSFWATEYQSIEHRALKPYVSLKTVSKNSLWKTMSSYIELVTQKSRSIFLEERDIFASHMDTIEKKGDLASRDIARDINETLWDGIQVRSRKLVEHVIADHSDWYNQPVVFDSEESFQHFSFTSLQGVYTPFQLTALEQIATVSQSYALSVWLSHLTKMYIFKKSLLSALEHHQQDIVDSLFYGACSIDSKKLFLESYATLYSDFSAALFRIESSHVGKGSKAECDLEVSDWLLEHLPSRLFQHSGLVGDVLSVFQDGVEEHLPYSIDNVLEVQFILECLQRLDAVMEQAENHTVSHFATSFPELVDSLVEANISKDEKKHIHELLEAELRTVDKVSNEVFFAVQQAHNQRFFDGLKLRTVEDIRSYYKEHADEFHIGGACVPQELLPFIEEQSTWDTIFEAWFPEQVLRDMELQSMHLQKAFFAQKGTIDVHARDWKTRFEAWIEHGTGALQSMLRAASTQVQYPKDVYDSILYKEGIVDSPDTSLSRMQCLSRRVEAFRVALIKMKVDESVAHLEVVPVLVEREEHQDTHIDKEHLVLTLFEGLLSQGALRFDHMVAYFHDVFPELGLTAEYVQKLIGDRMQSLSAMSSQITALQQRIQELEGAQNLAQAKVVQDMEDHILNLEEALQKERETIKEVRVQQKKLKTQFRQEKRKQESSFLIKEAAYKALLQEAKERESSLMDQLASRDVGSSDSIDEPSFALDEEEDGVSKAMLLSVLQNQYASDIEMVNALAKNHKKLPDFEKRIEEYIDSIDQKRNSFLLASEDILEKAVDDMESADFRIALDLHFLELQKLVSKLVERSQAKVVWRQLPGISSSSLSVATLSSKKKLPLKRIQANSSDSSKEATEYLQQMLSTDSPFMLRMKHISDLLSIFVELESLIHEINVLPVRGRKCKLFDLPPSLQRALWPGLPEEGDASVIFDLLKGELKSFMEHHAVQLKTQYNALQGIFTSHLQLGSSHEGADDYRELFVFLQNLCQQFSG